MTHQPLEEPDDIEEAVRRAAVSLILAHTHTTPALCFNTDPKSVNSRYLS